MYFQYRVVDAFHRAMYDLECDFHGGCSLDINLCLKHDLGNKLCSDMLRSIEPPCECLTLEI